MCQEFCSQGRGVWSDPGGVPAPNFRGGLLQILGGVSAPNFRGGVCSKFSGGAGCLLQIFGGGCLLQILGGWVSAPNFQGGGCLLQIFRWGVGVCSTFWGVSAPNFWGGVCSKFSGGSAPNFGGGVCSKFLGGCLVPGGCLQFSEYGQHSAGTHPTGMHSCLYVILIKNITFNNGGNKEHPLAPDPISFIFMKFSAKKLY